MFTNKELAQPLQENNNEQPHICIKNNKSIKTLIDDPKVFANETVSQIRRDHNPIQN